MSFRTRVCVCTVLTAAILVYSAPPSNAWPQTAADDRGIGAGVGQAQQPDPQSLDEAVALLGHDNYAVREQATLWIIQQGPRVADELKTRGQNASDPEIRHRINYILDAIIPPRRAVLVLRTVPGCRVQSGDLITHINYRRVRRAPELRRLAEAGDRLESMRVIGADGPRELHDFDAGRIITVVDFRAPRGKEIAAVVRLYATGYVEQAAERLSRITEPIPESEFPAVLGVLIRYTAGDAAALSGVLEQSGLADPTNMEKPWHSASQLDLAGPHKAPFHIEWRLWESQKLQDTDFTRPRDRQVQRVLVPANRQIDALRNAVFMWDRLTQNANLNDEQRRQMGNMLAITSWMLSDMDLASECLRLIGPRSRFLAFTWTRVRLKGWDTFLAGRDADALDEIFVDAERVLARRSPGNELIRNPAVAAALAFFLYQIPDDPRVDNVFGSVTDPTNSQGFAVLPIYARWMCYALHSENADVIQQHFAEALQRLGDYQLPELGRFAALLEYTRPRQNADVWQAARRQLALAGETRGGKVDLAAIDALRALASGRAREALDVLSEYGDEPRLRTVRHTAEFSAHPPPRAAAHGELSRPLAAVPVGKQQRAWLVLTAERRLVRFDAEAGSVVPIAPPSATWYPSPVTWPWLGRDENSGRVWVYGRRRVVEVCREGGAPLVLNIDNRRIPDFDRLVSPVFDAVAREIQAVPLVQAERGDFLRADVKAHGEFVADPDLPEIGVVKILPRDERVMYIAARGGPHMIVDRENGRVWSGRWMAEQLGLPRVPLFHAQAVWDADEPILMLSSDQGLIRFDLANESLRRIAMPGDELYPHLIPESAPYPRRDPRWAYVARLPTDGGAVFRVALADDNVERLGIINEAFPDEYYPSRSRAEIRREIDQVLAKDGMPRLLDLIRDAARYTETRLP